MLYGLSPAGCLRFLAFRVRRVLLPYRFLRGRCLSTKYGCNPPVWSWFLPHFLKNYPERGVQCPLFGSEWTISMCFGSKGATLTQKGTPLLSICTCFRFFTLFPAPKVIENGPKANTIQFSLQTHSGANCWISGGKPMDLTAEFIRKSAIWSKFGTFQNPRMLPFISATKVMVGVEGVRTRG